MIPRIFECDKFVKELIFCRFGLTKQKQKNQIKSKRLWLIDFFDSLSCSAQMRNSYFLKNINKYVSSAELQRLRPGIVAKVDTVALYCAAGISRKRIAVNIRAVRRSDIEL